MPDLPTRLDLYKIGADYVLQHAARIDPMQVNVDGSDVNLFCGIASAMGNALTDQLAYKVNALLLDGAEDEDLDRYAWDRYQIVRKGASAAVGMARIWRATAAAGIGTIPTGTRLITLTGVEYITTTAASFGASTLEVIDVKVRAVQAGKTGQVGANSIRKFAVPGDLFDSSMQINNDLTTAHGEEPEEDDEFKNRIRDFWRTVRRGTLGAIEFGARTVPGVASASAVEVTLAGNPVRVVVLYIADSSGVASSVIAQQVRDALLDYRAAGIQVLVYTSMPQIVDVELHLTFESGVDTDGLTDLVRNAVVEFVNTLPVSGTLYRAALLSVLQRYKADGLIVNDGTVVDPAGDLVPDPGVTLRTTYANVVVV